jgi:hypothetical protein
MEKESEGLLPHQHTTCWGCCCDTSKRFLHDRYDDPTKIQSGCSFFKFLQGYQVGTLATSSLVMCANTGVICCECLTWKQVMLYNFPLWGILFIISGSCLCCSICAGVGRCFIRHAEPNCGQYLDKIGCRDSAKAYEEYRTQRVTMSE